MWSVTTMRPQLRVVVSIEWYGALESARAHNCQTKRTAAIEAVLTQHIFFDNCCTGRPILFSTFHLLFPTEESDDRGT